MQHPEEVLCRILLIEDTPAEADIIRKLLQDGRRFAIDHVTRLEQALSRLAAQDYSVILMDLHLPDASGVDGCARILATAPLAPVIVLTNENSDELAMAAMRLGAQDYLNKREIDRKLLLRSVQYAIERHRSDARLRESEERYALAVAGTNDGVWDWNCKTDAFYYSPRWTEILGWSNETARASGVQCWLEQIDSQDRESFEHALNDLKSGQASHLEHEHRIRTPQGEERWLLVRGLAVRDSAGAVQRMAGSVSDITRRKQAESQLIHDALHDSLTKLPNRALYMDHLDLSLRRYLRDSSKLFAALYFDLDRFKNVNDSLGHAVGDQLLVEVALRLKSCLRPGDTLARLGGDEFAILLNDIAGPTDAIYVAERVRDHVTKPFSIEGHIVYTSASVGIAVSSGAYRKPGEILRDADLAMYRAKADSNVTYAVFDTNMHQQALAQHRLETDLRHALDAREFFLCYQPIVALEDSRVSGFEALIRWAHPERGVVNPDDFIWAAEETGLIVPIGWWGLAEACRQIKQWQQMFPSTPPLSVSVNVSGKLLLTGDLPKRLQALLEEWKLTPDSLRLEITENVVMDHGEIVMDSLLTLRALGIQLQIDDFGTGYSSLSYLQRFNYDTLKIDRSFVHSMSDKVDSSAIVEAIVTLGNTLGMRVIAEGVETPEQVRRLRAMRCPEAQGFWYSRPLPEREVTGLLEQEAAGGSNTHVLRFKSGTCH
ncbi:MAG: EAL domain-containing protein [Gammaproteobacteria bacterium]|nr:EAL domain-containing protein [Gammaproteobacteria bacterium]